MARAKRIVTGRMQRRLTNRLGPGFTVEKVTVRGVPGNPHLRTYTAHLRHCHVATWPPPLPAIPYPVWAQPILPFSVQAEGRTCPYDVLVIKARLLAEITQRGD
jgi:hypothetical protein